MQVMNMKIDKRFKVLELGPWTLYRPDERTFIFIIGEVDAWEVEMPEEQDNYILVTESVISVKDAMVFFLKWLEGQHLEEE